MKRIIDHFLMQWKENRYRKPLLLRGARQVGKTYAVRALGATYPHFVEINLEERPDAHGLFDGNIDPHNIIPALSLIAKQQIIPGKTLLFIDEIQMVPRAITALRYMYEKMPDLHVIAAGSLVDFAIEQIGIPVGRVESLYMHPVSFVEYLAAVGRMDIVNLIMGQDVHHAVGEVIHALIIRYLGEYLALGGMPDSVQRWIEEKNALMCANAHRTLLDTYRQDFSTYARKLQVKYVELVFNEIPIQMGQKFKYSAIEGDFRKRELAPALDLLVTAGVAHKVYYSAGQGIPLGAQIDVQDYRVLFLDIGLAQTALGLDLAGWFLYPQQEFVNKGALVEAFVGQELLAYSQPSIKSAAYYWHKESRVQTAEVDYLIQIKGEVIPVEVKSGRGSTFRRLHYFLEGHQKSLYGIRFCAQDFSVHENIHSYPLYAIARIMSDANVDLKEAISLLGDTL